MEVRNLEFSEFLKTHRDRLSPSDVGLPEGGRRRVRGLRRAEVATLAGISTDYYGRIERGDVDGVSDDIMHDVFIALQLTPTEIDYCRHLLRRAEDPIPRHTRGRPRREQPKVLPVLIQHFIDSAPFPVWASDKVFGTVATNQLARILFSPFMESDAADENVVRYTFLDPTAQDFFPHWDEASVDIVATLRRNFNEDPKNRKLTSLVGELCCMSPEFAFAWGNPKTRHKSSGLKEIMHPDFGQFDLRHEALIVAENRDIRVFIFEPTTDTSTKKLDLVRNHIQDISQGISEDLKAQFHSA